VSRFGCLTLAMIGIHCAQGSVCPSSASSTSDVALVAFGRSTALQQDRSARLTLTQAAVVGNVAVGTVRNWRYRGWTTPDGDRRYLDVNADGYLLGDVLDAARDTRLSPQSHRRLRPPALVA